MKKTVLTLFATSVLFNFMNAQCTPVSGGEACITNVTFNTLNRTSAACENSPNYYTSVPVGTATTTVNQAVSYPLSVSIDASDSAIISVWIDYNQNGTFEASEWNQIATNALVSSTSTINILIPSNATPGQTGMRVRTRSSGSPNGATDACTDMYSGEAEDYVITIGAGTACSGAPTPGIASGPTGACIGVNFNLELTGYSSGVTGLTFQWQSASSIGGPYSNILNATTPTYATTQTATTYYQCIVTCGGSPATSTIVTIPMNSFLNCYCTPDITDCSSSDVITNVTIGTINSTTTCSTDGYGTYTTPTATLNQAVSYPISVTIGSGYTEYVAVWIDYNQNGTFETSEFTALGSSSTGGPITSNILISGTATVGATMMRVRIRYSTPLTGADACLAYTFGETEDYLVTIGAGTTCSGTIIAGTASATNDSACSGTNFDLILTGYSAGVTGLTFQWQSSPTSGGIYTNIAGTTPTYTTSQTATTYYHCIVTCSGGSSVTSNSTGVLLTPFLDCYCNSTATSAIDEDIFNVTVGMLSNWSDCNSIGGPGSVLKKYSDYTTLVAAPDIGLNAAIPFSVTIGTCGTTPYPNAFKIFIDYNRNGSFADAGETVYASDTVSGAHTQTGTFTVPAGLALGNTLMRVVCSETDYSSSVDSCGTYSWGETEDYLVNIALISGINENTIGDVSIYPNPTTGLFTITTNNASFKELMISVFDIQGKEVFNVLDKNASPIYNKQINLESLAKGLYYIKLNTDAGVKVQKLIIQ